jgi:hypothetical protein
MTTELTKEIVEQLLAYDPETGEFRWRVSRGNVAAGSVAGHLQVNGYLRVSVFYRRYLAHRLAFLLMTGQWPPEQVDHKDGDPSNNRWENLRAVTHSENMHNQKRAHRNNGASGFLGVSPSTHSKKNPWRAAIRLENKQRHLGYFTTAEEAYAAYMAAKRELHPAYIHKEEEE